MENLISIISNDDCRGVVRSADGQLHRFTHGGVVDLYRLVTEHPGAVAGGVIADRVIGRGAALLLVKGGISRVYAFVMSSSAAQVLQAAGIECACNREVDHIVNRAGTGMCPVEKATLDTCDPDEAVIRIKAFLEGAGIIQKQ